MQQQANHRAFGPEETRPQDTLVVVIIALGDIYDYLCEHGIDCGAKHAWRILPGDKSEIRLHLVTHNPSSNVKPSKCLIVSSSPSIVA